MYMKFVDETGSELVAAFDAARIPASGEVVDIGGTERVVSGAPPSNRVEGNKMITTVVLIPAPESTPRGARTAHGKKELQE